MQISSKNVCDICVNLDAGRRRELAPVKLVAWRSQGQLQEKEERASVTKTTQETKELKIMPR